MPLMLVQNEERGPTVFTTDEGKTHTWFPKGDSLGRDTMRLSDALLEDSGFLTAIERGSLSVVEAKPETREQVDEVVHRAAERRGELMARQQGADDAVQATIDRRQGRDLLPLYCVGPGPAGRNGTCGAQVIQRAEESGAVPPLCSGHVHLRGEYVGEETGSAGSDTDPKRTIWTRVTR